MLKLNIKLSKIYHDILRYFSRQYVDYNKYNKVIYKRPINKYLLLIMSILILFFVFMNP